LNELRPARRGAGALAQPGAAGEVSRVADREVGRLGWRSTLLDAARHDDAHVAREADSPPAAGTGQRQAPCPNTRDWEREAHWAAFPARRP